MEQSAARAGQTGESQDDDFLVMSPWWQEDRSLVAKSALSLLKPKGRSLDERAPLPPLPASTLNLLFCKQGFLGTVFMDLGGSCVTPEAFLVMSLFLDYGLSFFGLGKWQECRSAKHQTPAWLYPTSQASSRPGPSVVLRVMVSEASWGCLSRPWPPSPGLELTGRACDILSQLCKFQLRLILLVGNAGKRPRAAVGSEENL